MSNMLAPTIFSAVTLIGMKFISDDAYRDSMAPFGPHCEPIMVDSIDIGSTKNETYMSFFVFPVARYTEPYSVTIDW